MENGTPEWLILTYTLPAEPSRFRVSIWRRLRKLGAVYMNDGYWVTPRTDVLAADIASVMREVQSFGGIASAFVSRDLEDTQGERLRGQFIEARNEEYSELQGQYEKFALHVDHARQTRRLTFAEVEELEEEIAKLERWLAEIKQRDLFNSPAQITAMASLENGRALLQGFTNETFAFIEAAQNPIEAPDVG